MTELLDQTDLIAFDNTYARMPGRFFAPHAPSPVAAPRLLRLNQDLARLLRLDPAKLASPEGVSVLAGNRIARGSEPIAMAYAGHQFGRFVPMLGDGRAVLLGEIVGRDGLRRDIHLKGSGPTTFSRRGDGRAALGPVLREYILSEAMAALGVPTTRALAVVSTGEIVLRETQLPGAVLTRVALSHIRVGTFQFFAARDDRDGVRHLADYTIARLYPEAAWAENPYRALLDAVIVRQAELVAQWMLIAFIHGVMNTDNMSISGETIDYGPCAFMDAYHPATVYSSIDGGGRYAYGNQPRMAQWNLARFAETLIPLLADSESDAIKSAQEAIDAFGPRFDAAYRAGFNRKLGLTQIAPGDDALGNDLLALMEANGADFTQIFRLLSQSSPDAVRARFADAEGFDAWLARWQKRLAEEPTTAASRQAAMRAVNPVFIPRNHLVEDVIRAATGKGDFVPFETLLTVLSAPYEDQPAFTRYAEPPLPDEIVHQTFCGT